jgi:hypothetical protein
VLPPVLGVNPRDDFPSVSVDEHDAPLPSDRRENLRVAGIDSAIFTVPAESR